MNSHKIGYQKRKNSTFKYISLFLFGILFALMATQAFTIVTGIENAVQYIKQIVVTSDGTASGTTGVFIEGLSGKVGANRFCDKNLTNCKKIDSIVTTGELTGYLTGSALVPYVMDDEINTLATSSLSCTNGQIPKFDGSTRSCGTDTDKYFSAASFSTSNSKLSLSVTGGGSETNIDVILTGANVFQKDTNGYYIPGTQNIGIGTNSTNNAKITINGDILLSNYMHIGDGSTAGIGQSEIRGIFFGSGILSSYDSQNEFYSYGSGFLNITNQGKVGIGTGSPSTSLEVNGSGKFNGNLIINGTIKLKEYGEYNIPICNNNSRGDILYSFYDMNPCYCNGTYWKKFKDDANCLFNP